jgi:hypothetical protein
MPYEFWRTIDANMKIKIYGYPYLQNEHIFCDNNIIEQLYCAHGDDIVNYIDGAYSIIIYDNNITIIITDQYGFYPLFRDLDYNIFDNISKYVNNIDNLYYNYIKLNDNNNLDHSILYNNNNSGIFRNLNATRTVFNNIKLIPPKSIIKIKNNKVISNDVYKFKNKLQYSLLSTIEYFNTLITDLIKNSKKKYIISPLTGGHDSRNIYYYLKRNNYTNDIHYTYYPETDFIKNTINDKSVILYDMQPNFDVIDEFVRNDVDMLNGMSDLYYFYYKYLPVKNILTDESLFITSDGADEFLGVGEDNLYYNALIENSSHSHIIKKYCNKCMYLPIYANRVFVDSVINKNLFMNLLSFSYGFKPVYYEDFTNTRKLCNYFNSENKNTLKLYYNYYIGKTKYE